MPITDSKPKKQPHVYTDDCISFFQKKVFGAGNDKIFMAKALGILQQRTGVDLTQEGLRSKADIKQLQNIVSELNRGAMSDMLDETAENEKFKPY